ncbi:MAG: chromate resistance protein [Burkholderiales bacterium]|nr:chromate resistance protein [Burkholderiales bacterium]
MHALWLIAHFIAEEPEFLYLLSGDVLRITEETGAIPYDNLRRAIACGRAMQLRCFLRKYELIDPALQQLAEIVRGADTSRLDLIPQSADDLTMCCMVRHAADDVAKKLLIKCRSPWACRRAIAHLLIERRSSIHGLLRQA